MGEYIKVIAQFIDNKTGEPVSGKNYRAKLLDRDLGPDDHLGEAKLEKDGKAVFECDLANARMLLSPLEMKPDLYLVLYRDNKEVFQSKVFENIDFLERDSITKERKHNIRNLGIFKIDVI